MNFSPQFLSAVSYSDFVKQITSGTITIDNSTFSQWQSCFVAGLKAGALRRMPTRSRTALAFGAATHVGLEALFRKFHFNEVRDMLGEALAEAATEALDNLGDPRRNTNTLSTLLESYRLEYTRRKAMQFNILTINGSPCVEQSFVVPLGSIVVVTKRWGEVKLNILWSGKIDLLTKFEGAITPVDHKTTTVMGERFVDDKVRSSQMLGYTYATRYIARQAFGEVPIFGARINALAMRSAGFEFKTFEIPYPDWKVAEWQAETLAGLSSLVIQLDTFLSSGIGVPSREHCVTKYGKCGYFDVCDCHPTMRDRMLFNDDYYFVSQWSPIE